MLLRTLNESGLQFFKAYILSLAAPGPQDYAPRGLLTREDTSDPVRPAVEVDLHPIGTRLEAAQRVDSILSPLPGGVRNDLETAPGFWAWLSLFYFDSVCPPVRGRRRPGDMARHVIDEKARNRYRHLLASPYLIYKMLKPAHHLAMAALYTQVHQPGELAEQITGRQYLVGNKNIVAAYTQLYFDLGTSSHKAGAAGRGRGCSARFGTVLSQFDRTYDLGSMTASQIVDLLPDEFDRYRL